MTAVKPKATITIKLYDNLLPSATINGWDKVRSRDMQRAETSMNLALTTLRREERVRVKQRERQNAA